MRFIFLFPFFGIIDRNMSLRVHWRAPSGLTCFVDSKPTFLMLIMSTLTGRLRDISADQWSPITGTVV